MVLTARGRHGLLTDAGYSMDPRIQNAFGASGGLSRGWQCHVLSHIC